MYDGVGGVEPNSDYLQRRRGTEACALALFGGAEGIQAPPSEF